MATNETDEAVPGDGHYIAKWDRAKCMEVARPSGEPEVWVPAGMFMEVQKERDDYRRALGFISAWRAGGMQSISTLDALLRNAGFDHEGGRAILGIIQWACENQPKEAS